MLRIDFARERVPLTPNIPDGVTMTKRFLILFSIALLSSGLACSLSDLPLPGGDSAEAPETSSEVLFSDDFGDSGTGWEVGDYAGGSVGYGNGVYFVTSHGNGDTMWGVANRGFDNLTVSVNTRQISAPSNDNNDYGVVCRIQPEGEGYYFLISGDGFFSILRADESEFVPLIDWTSTDVVRQGNSSNDILATCNGADLSLHVNGELVASVSDFTYRSGDLALTATSYEDAGTEVHFDNLTVTRP